MAPPTIPATERFQGKWTAADMGHDSECWLWDAWVDKDGYGGFYDGTRNVRAHRFSYEHHRGPIPVDMTIDHLCNVPRCVNPDHLGVATAAANALRGDGPMAINARKTHCIHGHAFDEANTYIYRGQRRCRRCGADRVAARRAP